MSSGRRNSGTDGSVTALIPRLSLIALLAVPAVSPVIPRLSFVAELSRRLARSDPLLQLLDLQLRLFRLGLKVFVLHCFSPPFKCDDGSLRSKEAPIGTPRVPIIISWERFASHDPGKLFGEVYTTYMMSLQELSSRQFIDETSQVLWST